MSTLSIVLVGPPGAGKTTVGRALADRLGVGFRDTDADIVAAEGREIADIFVEAGEAYFRSVERVAVARALDEHDGVLALGGGAVLDADTRQLLDDRTVGFLDVGVADATKRVGLSRDRPVLALNPRATLHRLLAERRPLYEQVATVTVVTDGLSPEDVVDALAGALEGL